MNCKKNVLLSVLMILSLFVMGAVGIKMLVVNESNENNQPVTFLNQVKIGNSLYLMTSGLSEYSADEGIRLNDKVYIWESLYVDDIYGKAGTRKLTQSQIMYSEDNFTDNCILRGDGTEKKAQPSSATIDDSGNIATSGTVDGVDVSSIPSSLAGKMNLAVPSAAGNLGALNIAGQIYDTGDKLSNYTKTADLTNTFYTETETTGFLNTKPAKVSPSVVGNIVEFSSITGDHQDSGKNIDNYSTTAEVASLYYNESETLTITNGKKPYNGFQDRTATLSMDGDKATITGNHTIWSNGTSYAKTTAQIACTFYGENYVYYNTSGVLSVANSIWDIESDNVPIAIVYQTPAGRFKISEERHGYNRDRAWHKWAHYSIGARYSGTGLTLTCAPGIAPTFSVSAGYIYDEDISRYITPAQTTCKLWYRDAAHSYMETVATPSTTLAYISGGNLQYDNNSGTTAAGANKYICYYTYASMDSVSPIYTVVGQVEHTTIANARAEALPTINGMETREWKLIYKTIWKNTGGGEYVENVDYRTVTSLPGGGTTAQSASSVTFAPTSVITATDVQSAISALGTAALTPTGDYATSAQGTLATNAMPKGGGTFTGNVLFTDNTLDIGASGATRPRTGYFGTSVVTPGIISGSGSAKSFCGVATSKFSVSHRGKISTTVAKIRTMENFSTYFGPGDLVTILDVGDARYNVTNAVILSMPDAETLTYTTTTSFSEAYPTATGAKYCYIADSVPMVNWSNNTIPSCYAVTTYVIGALATDPIINNIHPSASTRMCIRATTDASFSYFADKDGNEIMTVDSTNNRVGIGDATPDSALQVAGGIHASGASGTLSLGDATDMLDRHISFLSDKGDAYFIYNYNDDDFTISKTIDATGFNTSAVTGSYSINGVYALGNRGVATNTVVGNGGNSIAAGGLLNVVVGDLALDTVTSADECVAIGYKSLTANTSGGITAVGTCSGYSQNDATHTTYIGYKAGYANVSGHENTAVGYYSAYHAKNAGNTALGAHALQGYENAGCVPQYNTAVGLNAMLGAALTSASYNVAIGYNSMDAATTAHENVVIGYGAGTTTTAITTGSHNTIIGNAARTSAGSSINQIVIGDTSYGVGDNSITLGNTSITNIYSKATSITGLSDRKVKKEIQEWKDNLGLDFISALKPKTFKYIEDETQTERLGLIAQEVQESMGGKIDGHIVSEVDGTMYLTYGNLIMPMINAIRQLKEENADLRKRVDKLENQFKSGVISNPVSK